MPKIIIFIYFYKQERKREQGIYDFEKVRRLEYLFTLSAFRVFIVFFSLISSCFEAAYLRSLHWRHFFTPEHVSEKTVQASSVMNYNGVFTTCSKKRTLPKIRTALEIVLQYPRHCGLSSYNL